MNIVWFSWKDLSHPAAGGAEVITDILLSQLAADGHTVTLLTSTAGNKPREERNGYQIIREGGRLGVYFAARKHYLANLKKDANIVIDECNTLPFMTKFYAGKEVKNYMFFHMLCRIIWFYELPKYLGWIGWLAEPIYLRMLSDQKAIVVSNSTSKDIQRYGFKADKISIISEAIELEPVKNLEEIKKFNNPTVLGLGTMRSMKQALDQVKAFEIAKVDIPDLKLILAGDDSGKYGAMVKDYASKSKYSNDIKLLGRVAKSKKIELMQRSHALLVTSVKEGWGLVVTEANSQGTPAVVYDADGLRDSVKHRKTGYVTFTNPESLAGGIKSLILNDFEYTNIRQRGYNWSKRITNKQAYTDFKKVFNV